MSSLHPPLAIPFCPGGFPCNALYQGPGDGAPGWDPRHHPLQRLCLQNWGLGLGAADRPGHLRQSRVPQEASGGSRARVFLPEPEVVLGLRNGSDRKLESHRPFWGGQRRGGPVAVGLVFLRLPSCGRSSFEGCSKLPGGWRAQLLLRCLSPPPASGGRRPCSQLCGLRGTPPPLWSSVPHL